MSSRKPAIKLSSFSWYNDYTRSSSMLRRVLFFAVYQEGVRNDDR